jgi:hypothetical protein
MTSFLHACNYSAAVLFPGMLSFSDTMLFCREAPASPYKLSNSHYSYHPFFFRILRILPMKHNDHFCSYGVSSTDQQYFSPPSYWSPTDQQYFSPPSYHQSDCNISLSQQIKISHLSPAS